MHIANVSSCPHMEVGLKGCNFTKIRPQHRYFLWYQLRRQQFIIISWRLLMRVSILDKLYALKTSRFTCPFLKSDPHPPKSCFYFHQRKPFKNDEICFLFHVRSFFVFEIFTFLSWHFGYIEKRLHKKAMVKFKIYYVTDWTTNNYSTHIVQYLKK